MATDFESALPVRNSTVTGYTSLAVTPDTNAVFTVTPDPNAVVTVTPDTNAVFTTTPEANAVYIVEQNTASNLNATVTPDTNAVFTTTPDTNAVFTVTPDPNAQFEVIQANSVLLNATVFGNDGTSNKLIKTDANGVVQVAVTSAVATTPVNAPLVSLSLGTTNEAVLEYNPSVTTFNFNDIWATASGKIKLEVYIHTSGVVSAATIRSSGTLSYTGFSSTANPNINKSLGNNGITVSSGNSVYYIITNKDNQSQDVYGTVGGWS